MPDPATLLDPIPMNLEVPRGLFGALRELAEHEEYESVDELAAELLAELVFERMGYTALEVEEDEEEEEAPKPRKAAAKPAPAKKPAGRKPDHDLGQFELSGPAVGALIRHGLTTPAKIATCTLKKLNAIDGLGNTSIERIVAHLADLGLKLR